MWPFSSPGERECRNSTLCLAVLYSSSLALLPHCVLTAALEGRRVATDILVCVKIWDRGKWVASLRLPRLPKLCHHSTLSSGSESACGAGDLRKPPGSILFLLVAVGCPGPAQGTLFLYQSWLLAYGRWINAEYQVLGADQIGCLVVSFLS